LAKGLVIVESPAKAKTIQKYLGAGFEVEASLGHIKDLPKKSLGVDLDNNFSTEYEVIPGKEKVVARLKKLAKGADAIYLAPDPDREGEAIAAHLAEELGGDRIDGKKTKKTATSIRRVTFNEITKKAVQEAFQHARDIDRNLVDALLLGAKRIGHRFALSRHPYIMKQMKELGVYLELCPISNQILGLTPRMGRHSIYSLLANNVHCTVSSDNGTLFR
jgi:reverse gyrase